MNFNEVHQTYTKINTLYKRDEKGNIVIGDFSRPEFEYLFNCKWRAFYKIDGTNMSYYWDGHEMQIHGKSESAQSPKHLLKKMQELLTVEKLQEVFPLKYDENGNEIPFIVRIYGEGYGAKIQKCGGSYIKNDCNFRVFDIKINQYWLDWENVVDICEKLNLEMTIPYGEMTLAEAEDMVVKGFKSPIAENPELDAEGLVLRPIIQLYNKQHERIMVKIKTGDYRKCGITYNDWLKMKIEKESKKMFN